MADLAVQANGDFMEVSYSFTYDRKETEKLDTAGGIVVTCNYCKEKIVTTPHRYIRGQTHHICNGFMVCGKFYRYDDNDKD